MNKAEQAIKEQGGILTTDGWVVEDDLGLSYLNLTQLPKIYKVGGSFWCGNNELTSLQGAPQTVGGGFYCHNNKLTSLQGAPQAVGGNFSCYDNKLISLQGAPQIVGGNFDCCYNNFDSLEGLPEKISGTIFISKDKLNSFQLVWLQANYKVELYE